MEDRSLMLFDEIRKQNARFEQMMLLLMSSRSRRGSPTSSQESRASRAPTPPAMPTFEREPIQEFAEKRRASAANSKGNSTLLRTPARETPATASGKQREEVTIAETVKLERRASRRDREDLPPPPAPSDNSAGNSDSSDSEFSDSSQGGLIADRRASMLQPARTTVAPIAVAMHKEQPDYKYIHLKYLYVNEVFKFWSDIAQYQAKYGIELTPNALIDKDCVRRIMVKCKILSELAFYKLPAAHLRKCIQKTIRPTDKGMFSKYLSRAASLGKEDDGNFALTVDNYQRFYDLLLVYREEFLDKFNFLAYHNKENIPRLDNKDGGIIKIFLSKLPKEYADRVFLQLPKSRFESLEEFLSEFYKIAKEHYKIATKTKVLASFIPSATKRPFPSSVPRGEDAKPRFVPRVNHVRTEYHSDEDDYYDSPAEPPLEAAASEEALLDPTLDPKPDGSSLNAFGGGMNRGVPVRPPPKPPMANRPPAGPKGPNGCFRALTEGKCSKPNCSFDHTIPVLLKTHEDLLAKLNKKLYMARAVNAIHVPDAAFEPVSDKDG
jgi:hypothetical protein